MLACSECFGDRILRKEIIPVWSAIEGRCSYCQSERVRLIEPQILQTYFQLLSDAYTPADEGRLLVEWFKDDWGLFDHPMMDVPRSQALLAAILDDGNIVLEHFAPLVDPTADQLGDWETFRDELRYKNRFFPQVNLDYERLATLLTFLEPSIDELPEWWNRARIKSRDDNYTVDEMGAPPRGVASHGRANPAGIPYLYVASDRATAVSEIRPHTGQTACVGTFRLDEGLRLIDLRTPKKTVSPFLFEDLIDVVKMRNDIPFLEKLGEELTRPVVPAAAATDYTPSQYLCEFIKSKGYGGVLYRSSVSAGINLALFDPLQARCESVDSVEIGRVTVALIDR